jgi:hypothetical protein
VKLVFTPTLVSIKIPDRVYLPHVDEIGTAYHRNEIGIRRTAVDAAFRTDPLAGATLAVLTWVSPVDVLPAGGTGLRTLLRLRPVIGSVFYHSESYRIHNVVQNT